MSHLQPLDSQPEEAIEALLNAAFGRDRHGRTAYMIRQGMPWLRDLSFAMMDDGGALVGTGARDDPDHRRALPAFLESRHRL